MDHLCPEVLCKTALQATGHSYTQLGSALECERSATRRDAVRIGGLPCSSGWINKVQFRQGSHC